jgi:hypothetical protein
MQTIVEFNQYRARVEKLLSAEERDAVIDTIVANPLQGDIMAGTGGVRKMRFAKEGKGKSGGVRVVYYYYDADVPIYLLTAFGKNEMPNLSKAERNALAKVVADIKKEWRSA